MHKTLLNEASNEQIRQFVDDALTMLRETNHDLYDDLEMYLYKEIHGCHFTEWLVEKATAYMTNEDGTIGRHWTIDQTTSVAKQNGITFDRFNEYDWNYVMNMIYSDYYGAVPNETSSYIKLSKKFLEDKDAKEGKALKYFLSFKN